VTRYDTVEIETMATIDSLSNDIASLRNELKNLAKLVRKVRSHQEDPTGEKQKARTKNNGFNRKMEVTNTLKEFLGLDADGTVSRSDVTRRINKYIKENDLKHPDNGRVIVMDEKLTKLLSPPEGEQITFLNMQKYISPHYLKVAEEVVEEVADAAETLTELVGDVTDVVEAVKKATKRPTVKKAKA